MPVATNSFYSNQTGMFNQIAMFSLAGLSFSMMLFIEGGLQVVSPWF